MNIVLVGAGEVGFNLSKLLSKEGYSLRIIVRSSDKFPKELLEKS